jgi:hypothetical protein
MDDLRAEDAGGSLSGAGNSQELRKGTQKRRIRSPMGVPGPTLVIISLTPVRMLADRGVQVDRRLVYSGSQALLRAATLAHLNYPSLPETLVLDAQEVIGEHFSLLHQCRLDAVKGGSR